MSSPTDRERIEQAVEANGFIVLSTDDPNHVRILHPETGRHVSLPINAPQRRALAVTYRNILTRAGQRPHRATPDTDRERQCHAIEDLMHAPNGR